MTHTYLLARFAAIIAERDAAKADAERLAEALESLRVLARLGVASKLAASHPEERAGHSDALDTLFDDANVALAAHRANRGGTAQGGAK